MQYTTSLGQNQGFYTIWVHAPMGSATERVPGLAGPWPNRSPASDWGASADRPPRLRWLSGGGRSWDSWARPRTPSPARYECSRGRGIVPRIAQSGQNWAGAFVGRKRGMRPCRLPRSASARTVIGRLATCSRKGLSPWPLRLSKNPWAKSGEGPNAQRQHQACDASAAEEEG